VRLSIDALKTDSLNVWNSSSSTFPETKRCYTADQQLRKEAEVDCLMHDVDADVSSIPQIANRRGKRRCLEVRGRIQRAIVQLLHSFDCVIDDDMETRFSFVTDEFIRRAYDFDPDIGDEAVYQASRNVLIMNTIQMYLGKEVGLTPSVFAYSMLYPYTDNYLDAVNVDVRMKREANDRLMLRLSGILVPARNGQEQTIDRLVCMIEKEFDRNDSPQVFESLLAIHRGQIRSVSQCDSADLTSDHLLDISIEKGGTSVLADGCLVAGELSEPDAIFLFRFGVLLQLIDDLQDLEEDFSHGQRTLVGLLSGQNSLHSFTNHLQSYLDAVVGPITGEQSPDHRKLRALIERSCRLLIFEAIATNEGHYDGQFVAMMEPHSPVRFNYLRAVQGRLRNKYSSHGEENFVRMRKTKGVSRRRILEFMR
jgi:hypothetical protein